MKKKMVGILMGVAMTATTIAAPTAIFADDIDIEDIAVETEEDDVADVEVEDEAEPAEEVAAEDDFSAEADDAEGLFTDAEAADFETQNAKAVVSADVIASAAKADNDYICYPDHITVYSNAAEDMGYKDKVDQETAVSALDVLVTLHKEQYPTMTSATATNYLELWYQESLTAGGAWIDKMFGVETNVPDNYMLAYSLDGSVYDYINDGKITFTVPEDATTTSIWVAGQGTASYRYVMPHIELVVK